MEKSELIKAMIAYKARHLRLKSIVEQFNHTQITFKNQKKAYEWMETLFLYQYVVEQMIQKEMEMYKLHHAEEPFRRLQEETKKYITDVLDSITIQETHEVQNNEKK